MTALTIPAVRAAGNLAPASCVASQRADRRWALAIGVILLCAYQANGDLLPLNDALVSMALAESMLHQRDMSLTADEIPSLFLWEYGDSPSRHVRVSHLNDQLRDMRKRGLLRARFDEEHNDVLVPTRIQDAFASTFAPGVAFCAVPVFAVANLIASPLYDHPLLYWYAAKLVASLCVAASAVYLFLAARMFVDRPQALFIAFAYGLGTGVWSTSSQALWQHPGAELFIAMAAYYLTRLGAKPSCAAKLGAAVGMATLCRPTGAILALSLGGYLLLANRKQFAAYVLAGLPWAVGMSIYNWYYLGSPFHFGQTEITTVAQWKTGNPIIWQTPLAAGALGLLISPSRGLFIYSPFLVFALVGGWLAWTRREYTVLRPLIIAVLGIWLIEFRHFDWWGGWSYGYRHIVDTVPMLVLLLAPVMPWLQRRWAPKAIFAALVAWSVFVQFLGAFAYDFRGWNGRVLYTVHPADAPSFSTFSTAEVAVWRKRGGVQFNKTYLNIDEPAYRHRLWSFADSQIAYYATHFAESRQLRKMVVRLLPFSLPCSVSDTYVEVGRAQMDQGDMTAARDSFIQAWNCNPRNAWAADELSKLYQRDNNEAEAARWRKRRDALWRHPFQMFQHLLEIDLGDLERAVAEFESDPILSNAARFESPRHDGLTSPAGSAAPKRHRFQVFKLFAHWLGGCAFWTAPDGTRAPQADNEQQQCHRTHGQPSVKGTRSIVHGDQVLSRGNLYRAECVVRPQHLNGLAIQRGDNFGPVIIGHHQQPRGTGSHADVEPVLRDLAAVDCRFLPRHAAGSDFLFDHRFHGGIEIGRLDVG
jgi:hypothetical protein